MDECRELVDEECLAQVDPKSFKYRLYKRVHPKQTKKELVQVIMQGISYGFPSGHLFGKKSI